MIVLTDKNGIRKESQSSSYLLLTIENGSVKFNGDVALQDLGPLLPLLMKSVMEKLTK